MNKIISNHTKPLHGEIINQLIKQSDEIIICVAFLKSSGLKILNELEHKVGKCKFYIGTDLFITEPKAIKRLLEQEHTVYKIQKAKSTYHSKIYYFRQNDTISILIGSANLTRGGLKDNFETSFLIDDKVNSEIDNEFKIYLNILSKNKEDFKDEEIFKKYIKEFERNKIKLIKSDVDFYSENLKEIVKKYLDNDIEQKKYKNRIKNHELAKEKLNQIISKSITSPSNFLEYYDEILPLYSSSGLPRGKNIYSQEYEKLISFFKIVQRYNNIEPELLFKKVTQYHVKRFGINAITELMNTYNSNKYSIVNHRTLKSLSKLDFQTFPDPNNFKSENYMTYNALLTQILTKFNFENLGHVDHFLSWFYSNYIKSL